MLFRPIEEKGEWKLDNIIMALCLFTWWQLMRLVVQWRQQHRQEDSLQFMPRVALRSRSFFVLNWVLQINYRLLLHGRCFHETFTILRVNILPPVW
jgi:hypothetical protein